MKEICGNSSKHRIYYLGIWKPPRKDMQKMYVLLAFLTARQKQCWANKEVSISQMMNMSCFQSHSQNEFVNNPKGTIVFRQSSLCKKKMQLRKQHASLKKPQNTVDKFTMMQKRTSYDYITLVVAYLLSLKPKRRIMKWQSILEDDHAYIFVSSELLFPSCSSFKKP